MSQAPRGQRRRGAAGQLGGALRVSESRGPEIWIWGDGGYEEEFVGTVVIDCDPLHSDGVYVFFLTLCCTVYILYTCNPYPVYLHVLVHIISSHVSLFLGDFLAISIFLLGLIDALGFSDAVAVCSARLVLLHASRQFGVDAFLELGRGLA